MADMASKSYLEDLRETRAMAQKLWGQCMMILPYSLQYPAELNGAQAATLKVLTRL